MKTSKTALTLVVVAIVLVAALTLVVPSALKRSTTGSGSNSGKAPSASSQYSTEPQYSQFITEFPTQTSGSLPNVIAFDSRGNVWTVLQNLTALAEFFPSNNSYRTFVLPEPRGAALTTWGMTVDNSRGLVWFSDEQSNAIWSFSISNRTFEKYPLKTSESIPYQVALDGQGDLWFTEFSGDKLGEITRNGTIKEIPIPLSPSEPTGICLDAKTGIVYFNLILTGFTNEFFIGSYYEGSFAFTNITSLAISPMGLSLDPNGNEWIAQHGASFVSEYNPTNGTFKTISTSVPPAGESNPYFVCYDDESGDVWFNEQFGNSIGEYIPSTNSLIEYEIPTRLSAYGNISGAMTMSLSPDGTPWFTELYAGKLGEINTSAPLGLSISLNGNAFSNDMVSISNGTSLTLDLSVNSSSQSVENLGASLGNFTGSFTFNFAQSSGTGSFGTTITIENNGSPDGIYCATISVKNSDIIVSKIIEIIVQ